MGDGDDYDLLDEGCTCPTGHPPCSFCTSLDADEYEVYLSGGADAVRAMRDAIENGEPWPPLPPHHDHPNFGRF
jgi:hypothetical protein